MAHSQARMPTLLDIARRPTESTYQEIAEAGFGPSEVVGWVHRAQNVVAGNLPVEGCDQPREAVFANASVNLCVVHDGRILRHARTSALMAHSASAASDDFCRARRDFLPSQV